MSPPPNLTRIWPGSMSSSSWTATSWSGVELVVVAAACCTGRAGLVHVGPRLDQREPAEPPPHPADRAAASATSARIPRGGAEARRRPVRQLLDHPEADVVPVPGVRRARDCRARPPARWTPQRSSGRELRRRRALGRVAAGLGSPASSPRRRPPRRRSARCRPRPRPRPARPRPASAVWAAVMLTISVSGSIASVSPRAASGRWPGSGCRPGRPSMETRSARDVGGLGLDRDAVLVDHDQGLRRRLALDVERDVDGDLLAAPHHHQVDVLDGVLQRVALHLLRQRQLGLAVRRRWTAGRWRCAAPAGSRDRAARCGSDRSRGRTARRGPCRRGGSGGQHPCRTPYAIRR